eukprot:UN04455
MSIKCFLILKVMFSFVSSFLAFSWPLLVSSSLTGDKTKYWKFYILP